MSLWAFAQGSGPAGGAEAARAVVRFTPGVALKTGLSFALSAAALYCLTTGRRDADLGRMTWAVVLALASIFLFF